MANSVIVPNSSNSHILDRQLSELLVLESHDNDYYIGRLRFHKETNTWFADTSEEKRYPRYERFSDAYSVLLSMK